MAAPGVARGEAGASEAHCVSAAPPTPALPALRSAVTPGTKTEDRGTVAIQMAEACALDLPASPSPAVRDLPASPSPAVCVPPDPAPPPPSWPRRRRSHLRAWVRVWHGLPLTCQLLLVMAVGQCVLTAFYSGATISKLPDPDSLHVAIIILLCSVFQLFCFADAVLWENMLELAGGAVLSVLTLSRVLVQCVSRGPSLAWSLGWGIPLLFFCCSLILLAWASHRRFGWRLYSRLGIDARDKEAPRALRAALVASLFTALYKLEVVLALVTLALGVALSFPPPEGDANTVLLFVSIGTALFSCAVVAVAVLALAQARARPWVRRRARWLLGLVPLGYAQPAATMALVFAYYPPSGEDDGAPRISVAIAGSFFYLVHTALWMVYAAALPRAHELCLVWGNFLPVPRGRLASSGAGGVPGSHAGVDEQLTPLLQGAWLGKPTRAHPRKLCFFQLSHDASTLRWGWDRYVRLFHLDTLRCDEAARTLHMTFTLDQGLAISFEDADTMGVWHRGLRRAHVLVMSPGAPPPPQRARGVRWGGGGLLSLSASLGSGGADPSQQTTWAAEISLECSRPLAASASAFLASPRGAGRRLHLAASDVGLSAALAAHLLAPQARADSGAVATARRAARDEPQAALALRLSGDGAGRAGAAAAAKADAAACVALLRILPQLLPKDLAPRRKGGRRDVATQTRAWEGAEVGDEVQVGLGRGDGASDAGDSDCRAAPSTALMLHELARQARAREGLAQSEVSGSGRARVASPATPPNSLPSQTERPSRAAGPAPASAQPSADELLAGQYAAMLAQGGAWASPGGGPGPSPAPPPPPLSSSDPPSRSSSALGFGPRRQDHSTTHRGPETPTGHSLSRSPLVSVALPGSHVALLASPLSGALSSVGGARAESTTSGAAAAASSPECYAGAAQHYDSGASTHEPSPGWPPRAAAQHDSTLLAPPELLPLPLSALLSPRGPQLLGLDLVAYEDLHFGGLLGRGGEAPVYAAWYRDTPVAVKVFGEAAAGARELGMYLKAGSHDNVVALRGVCGHAGAMYLLLEYCPRGTLDVALHFSSGARWDARKMVPIVRSVARGMHHLHTRGLLHRDIKPGNIFVGHGQMMKLGDLGMAREVLLPQPGTGALRKLSPGVVGTPQYAAPEILLDRPTPVGMEFGEAALRADVWSFGVTLWEILERRRPFDRGGKAGSTVTAGGHHPRLPPVSAGHHSEPAAQLRIRRELAALVEACTREDPRERLTSADVLQSLRAVGRIAGGRQV